MVTYEELQACKREGSSLPRPVTSKMKQDPLQQTSDHVYADWPALQAYYGPALTVPTYSKATDSSPHLLPPYMLRPMQYVMPAYATLYPYVGLYAQSGVHVASSSADIDSPAMSSEDDQGVKRLKRSDRFATSIINENRDSGKDSGISHSEGSDGNTTEGGQIGLKRSSEESPITSGAFSKTTGVTVASAKVLPKVGAISPNPLIGLDLNELPNASATMASSIVNSTPHKLLLQNDPKLRREKRKEFIREAATRSKSLIQDEPELKREWRKQCNREAAIRSRLKKQAVQDQLAAQVEALNTDNLSLKSEINRLTINSEKLKLENAKLMERLNTHKEQAAENSKKVSSFSTVNLLSRVDNSSFTAS